MSKIIIKNTRNADSRTADENLTREQLYEATELHREDVARGMKYIAEQLITAGQKHDWTKIKYFDQYAEDVLSGHTDEEFKNREWYNFLFQKFGTRDILDHLKPNGTYKIKYYGWREGFNNGIPNILSVEQVIEENNTPSHHDISNYMNKRSIVYSDDNW